MFEHAYLEDPYGLQVLSPTPGQFTENNGYSAEPPQWYPHESEYPILGASFTTPDDIEVMTYPWYKPADIPNGLETLPLPNGQLAAFWPALLSPAQAALNVDNSNLWDPQATSSSAERQSIRAGSNRGCDQMDIITPQGLPQCIRFAQEVCYYSHQLSVPPVHQPKVTEHPALVDGWDHGQQRNGKQKPDRQNPNHRSLTKARSTIGSTIAVFLSRIVQKLKKTLAKLQEPSTSLDPCTILKTQLQYELRRQNLQASHAMFIYFIYWDPTRSRIEALFPYCEICDTSTLDTDLYENILTSNLPFLGARSVAMEHHHVRIYHMVLQRCEALNTRLKSRRAKASPCDTDYIPELKRLTQQIEAFGPFFTDTSKQYKQLQSGSGMK
ncbi:hypothetical protein H4R35_000046 [Dimargaris xerosporica]|nr:hypothetical protein H4R35_000046 [Dimargaris xerosporica]